MHSPPTTQQWTEVTSSPSHAAAADGFKQRVFSGIQPTGTMHLGNYLGAVKRWAQQLDGADSLYSIVDLHAITLPQDPDRLRRQVLEMAASLIACGVDPDRCVLFQQSTVPQHTELAWILATMATVPQLARLSQYKEKAAKLKEIPLGLYLYPVLQSADILLYKATHVPVGEDQLQNIAMANMLRRAFYKRVGVGFFPRVRAVLTDDETCRLKSLRQPEKKMSKSDPHPLGFITLTDEPDAIVEKCKKAVTDFTSHVSFEPETRPGVSNLVLIHSSLTGQTPVEVCDESAGLTTAEYKLVLAQVIVEHLRPVREHIERLMADQDHLRTILSRGTKAAKSMAEETMTDVRRLIGFN